MRRILEITGPALILASCVTTTGTAAGDGALDVRAAMVDGVNPAALAIWEVGNDAVNDDGLPDPSRLSEEKLAGLREAAQLLSDYARRLKMTPDIKASGPDLVGGKVPEGVATREQIQAAIDANPAGFRALAASMGEQADAIMASIDSDNRAEVADRLVGFDGACQSCHERYWYVAQ